MRVAVTGASGFLGGYVLSELSQRAGVEIVAMTHRHPPRQVSNTAVSQIQIDIDAGVTGVYELLGRPDVLIHLAWPTLPHYKSLLHFENHLPAHYRFLKSLVEDGLGKLLCTGTCFEYGMRSGELTESLLPDPQNPYGFAKHALRQQLQLLSTEVPFRLTWARPFYMYGEGQLPTSLYSLVMSAGKRGDNVFPMSPGDQLRDYLHVSVVARHLVALALDACDGGTVNVCSGRPIAVRTLVEGWIRDNGWQMSLELGRFPYPDYEPMAFWGSVERLQRLLGRQLSAS
jgi:nucleoside-diphosphate-sugar epimerase